MAGNQDICDGCSELYKLAVSVEKKIHNNPKETLPIKKEHLPILYNYLGLWIQRNCLCLFRKQKNIDRLACTIQFVLQRCVAHLQNIRSELVDLDLPNTEKPDECDDQLWTPEDTERMLQFVSKVFNVQFPLYTGPKLAGMRAEELSPVEASKVKANFLSMYCEGMHEIGEFPVLLLRNITIYCKGGGLQGMRTAFQMPHRLFTPVMAHAMISVLFNLKLWLNCRAMGNMFLPLREAALAYLCQLPDAELRTPSARQIADFLWNSLKEGVDMFTAESFDRDGLELAFKYFLSTTLTMRLSGISQMNSYVSMLNELCNAESLVEAEKIGNEVAEWVVSKKIVEHIFGPNLHVEVIKQSHILLNFLAVEGKVNNDHINVIWQAAQLKHCSKQVHDLLIPLIKNLDSGPVLHLCEVIKELPVKDHTELTIQLAQALQRYIWTNGSYSTFLSDSSILQSSLPLSSSDEDVDSATAAAVVAAVNPLMATAAVLMASQQKAAAVAAANKKKELIDKGVLPPSGVDFPFSGDDDEDMNDFTEDDDEEDDDDDDDDDDEMEGDDEDDDDDDAADEDFFDDEEDVELPSKMTKAEIGSVKPQLEIIKKSKHSENKENCADKVVPIKVPEVPIKPSDGAKEETKAVSRGVKPGALKAIKRNRNPQEVSSDSDHEKAEKSPTAKTIESGKKRKVQIGKKVPVRPINGMDRSKGPLAELSEGVDTSQSLLNLAQWRNVSSPISGPSPAMAELANLVNVHPRTAGDATHDMRPFLQNLASQQRWHSMEDALSEENDSVSSSRLSNKTDKVLNDFDDENSGEEDNMLQIAQTIQHQQQLATMATLCHQQRIAAAAAAAAAVAAPRLTARQQRNSAIVSAYCKLDAACQEGSTLLWDLIQDKNISHLAEGIANEAEKALVTVISLHSDKYIRLKFIEGCLNNISRNESVAVSLRILPKIFTSFQNFRGAEVHEICQFAERRHGMIRLFFENLQEYIKSRREGRDPPPYFNHLNQIQIRLTFLSTIFSAQVSNYDFTLTPEQVNQLWDCLANDIECSDDFYQWVLCQVHSKEGHAISKEGLKMIYDVKLPTINPETISMLGLNLFSQLCTTPQLARHLVTEGSSAGKAMRMDQLWKIALCANNIDVSMRAVQILNTAYFGQGEEFLTTCMQSLESANREISSGKDEHLVRIQRALLLLKTYLETFRRKYAYHFRRLTIDGHGVSTHSELVDFRSLGTIRIYVHATGFPDKVPFDMYPNDLIGDLRAEVCYWWESKMAEHRVALLSSNSVLEKKRSSSGSGLVGSVIDGMHLRFITQGQEIPIECDEKSLCEFGIKDHSVVYVSQSASRSGLHSNSRSDNQAFPGKDRLPMNLLLTPVNFDLFFSLMKSLTELRGTNEHGQPVMLAKAQILSRRVWDILMLLPTNIIMKEALQNIDEIDEPVLKVLLNPDSPQKLLYTLYIVDWLGRPARLRRQSGPSDSCQNLDQTWMTKFIHAGGLKHLLNIFLSGVLQPKEGQVWCEWKQDCLSFLLKLLVQFGVDPQDHEALAEQMLENQTPRKRSRRHRGRQKSGVHPFNIEKLPLPRLSKTTLELIDADTMMSRITNVLMEISRSTKDQFSMYKTGIYGRAQVVHHVLSLLVSWVYSDDGSFESALFASNGLPAWLRSLLLDDHDPAVRRETCTGLSKMCLGVATNGRTGLSCTAPLLSVLLEFLDDALVMKPANRRTDLPNAMDECKESYGPACRDYFWILGRLAENLLNNDIHKSDEDALIDFESLARQLARGIMSRKLYEQRNGDLTPDDALVGALQLLNNVIKHQSSFKCCPFGQEFLVHLLECLFALPTPREKELPKCKSSMSRSACYDLILEMCKGCNANYYLLHGRLMKQHRHDSHKAYPWEYWPREDGRSECGYVGLTNLGATCYMAACIQQLYMIPLARQCILKSTVNFGENSDGKYSTTLYELQRMFAYLRDSQRKAYNPISFCKSYEMDHQPLNTGEQKDMTEFFIDLLSKMEEMTPELKRVVKKLFGGTLTNNVVSLDCEHVSRTAEDFYSIRCQVTEMRNLFQSLEEVTIKDTLDGDNMYTCSQCEKKVRAEKRACFKKLPKILAFNTMRYTFNMITMLKEKVNTHFSFPFHLDMSPYMEHNLIPVDKKNQDINCGESYDYELIGVTVHTGTADGGHYYAFIKERTSDKDKWYSFNDAEVKFFDPNQIASECFGGEMSSRTYDQVTEKFMDLSIEKTNSAYMLFYEKIGGIDEEAPGPSCSESEVGTAPREDNLNFDLSPELEDWIWQDNKNFIQDNNIFDHLYFNFMSQMVGYVPTTLSDDDDDVTLMSAKLATTFFTDSFIHAKEKLNIVQWIESLTKQFDGSVVACRWFLNFMSENDPWPVKIFLKCQVPNLRQMYQRLCIHVIQKLRNTDASLYLLPAVFADDSFPSKELVPKIGESSPVTRFARTLLNLVSSGTAKPHLKHLQEYFRFIFDFAKQGKEEQIFLLSVRAISTFVDFYLKIVKTNTDSTGLDSMSDEEEDDEEDLMNIVPVTESGKFIALEKLVWVVATLVEHSKDGLQNMHLSEEDFTALTAPSLSSGSKPPMAFLYHVIRDNVNHNQACCIIFSLAKNNPEIAEQVIATIVYGVKHSDNSMNFFRLLTMLVDYATGIPGLPCFTTLVMPKVADFLRACPHPALEWLGLQVTRNKNVQTWMLSTMDSWVEQYLLSHPTTKVRSSAAILVVNLVNSPGFRQAFRASRGLPSPIHEGFLNTEDLEVLHQILIFLFSLLNKAKLYTEVQQHGAAKLTAYFHTMTHFLISKKEKSMFEPYFMDLWNLFHPKLSEPSMPIHHNKQALLSFWHAVCVDCPQNVRLILRNQSVIKNIAYNYILADHEDTDVVMYNRSMLPTYYGLLRLVCQQSKQFTRQLAQHQNLQWALKNISPFSTQYTLACEELFKLMALIVQKDHPSNEKLDETDAERDAEITAFKHNTLQLYLATLDGRSAWNTLIQVLKILVQNDEDRLFVVFHNGLSIIYDAFHILHIMFHEATACHVTGDIVDLLSIFADLIKTLRAMKHRTEVSSVAQRWKETHDMTSRLLSVCNSFTPSEVRETAIASIKEMLYLWPQDMIAILLQIIYRSHSTTADLDTIGFGPFFPRRGHPLAIQLGAAAKSIRPPRAMLQMNIPAKALETHFGQDHDYDCALIRYFKNYHLLIDLMVRLAVNDNILNKNLIDLSAMVGLEGTRIHMQLFPKLWTDIFHAQQLDRKFILMLIQSQWCIEYIQAVLLYERQSLNLSNITNFMNIFLPKVADKVLTEQVENAAQILSKEISDLGQTYNLSRFDSTKALNGELQALLLLSKVNKAFLTNECLKSLLVLKMRLEKELSKFTVSEEKPSTSDASKRKRETSGSDSGEKPDEVKKEDPGAADEDVPQEDGDKNILSKRKRCLSDETTKTVILGSASSAMTLKTLIASQAALAKARPQDDRAKLKEVQSCLAKTLTELIELAMNDRKLKASENSSEERISEENDKEEESEESKGD